MRKQDFMNWSVESALRIGLVFLIILISFLIFKPFLILLVWGIIIAIAFYPLFKKITKLFKGQRKIAATFLTIILLAILIAPTILFINTLVDSSTTLASGLQDGSLKIPPPDQKVEDWPVIGNSIYEFWQLSSTNLEAAFERFGPQLGKMGGWLLESIGGLMGSVAIFFIALIISGLFLAKANDGYTFAVDLFEKLVGNNGKIMVDNSIATIQSVVKGVLGVAIIQAALVGLGFMVAGIPGASVLTLIVLLLAIIQLPPLLIVIPVVIYAFSTMDTGGAVIFTIWSLLAGASDNFLKPLLLGRGVDIPMLIILIGAIGGMMAGGIIGMFVGAVVLALGYQIFMDWVDLKSTE
jgi:predicted PurR-regulated permease PerM